MNRTFKISLLILTILLLAGCRERELSFERQFPDAIQKLQQAEHVEEEKTVGLSSLIGSGFPPRHLLLESYQEVSNDGMSTAMLIFNAYQFCWKAPNEQCTAPPRFIESPHQITLPVQTEVVVQMNLEESIIPFPKTVTLYQYADDGELIEMPFTDLGNYKYSFISSSEARTIQYLFKFIYEEEEVNGQSFYTFKITGK